MSLVPTALGQFIPGIMGRFNITRIDINSGPTPTSLYSSAPVYENTSVPDIGNVPDGELYLLWSHDLYSIDDPSTSFSTSVMNLKPWLSVAAGDPVVQLCPTNDLLRSPDVCSFFGCSDEPICRSFYYCLFDLLLNIDQEVPMVSSDSAFVFSCFSQQLAIESRIENDWSGFDIDAETGVMAPFRCSIGITSYSRNLDEASKQGLTCNNDVWGLYEGNWVETYVDANLAVAMQGGVDHSGVYWKGRVGGQSFAEAFAKPMRIPWVYLAGSAFRNIDQQLRNQYNQLEHAIESLALDTFSIDSFFPTKDQQFDLQNSLAGLGGIFSILGGFIPVPVAGSFISAAGTIASSVGTFLANSAAASNDPLEAQKLFSEKVLTFYRAILVAMEDAVAKLFRGDSIGGPGSESFNITDMMEGGAWVNPNALANVSQLNQKIRIEVLSRSIDSLWKTPPGNKMWVLFTDLKDDASLAMCAKDNTGPPDSKYCADGGVYYTYNFVPKAGPQGAGGYQLGVSNGEGGGVDWPWGADQLQPKANISLKV
ncbi:MAG: hypothetical protein Q9218_002853 [Villophora microphyllina]